MKNKIMNLLKEHGTLSGIEITEYMTGKKYDVQKQIRILIQEGSIDIDDNLRYGISNTNIEYW